MIKKLNKKKLVIGIVILFFGAVIVPSINANILNTNVEHNMITSSIITSPSSKNDDWWPMYRCDPGNCGGSSSKSPIRNQLSWKTNIGDEVLSSTPIVVDDKVFMSTGFFYDALNPPNLTFSNLFEGPTLFEIIEDLTSFNQDYYGGVYCLDADTGEQLWEYPMYAPNEPAVVDGKVYVTDIGFHGDSSNLYCIDAETGNLIWQKPIGYLVTSPTIVANNKIYLGTLDWYEYYGSLKCLDLNGNVIWSFPLPLLELVFFTAPAVNSGVVVFRTINLYYYYYEPGKLYCLNADTGQYKWSQTLSSFWYWFFGFSSPVCTNGKVYITDFDLYSYFGYLKCFNAQTGSLLWSNNIGLSFGTPAVCDNSIYITGIDIYFYGFYLFKFDANSGFLIWKAPIDYFYYFFFCSPICSKDHIFLGGGEFYFYTSDLICLSKEDGHLVWTYTLSTESMVTPSVADERVYTADSDGNVYAFEDMLAIGKISGTLFGVKAELKNIAESKIADVEWMIIIRGSILGGNKSFTGTINSIGAGKAMDAKGLPVFGLGNVNIEVRTTMPGLNDVLIKKAKGFILGIIIIITSR